MLWRFQHDVVFNIIIDYDYYQPLYVLFMKILNEILDGGPIGKL